MGVLSCNKVTKYANTPKISFNSMSMYTMKEGKDTTLNVFIEFEDGDGDISFGSENLFFIDTRDTDTVAYTIPTIPDRFEPKRGLRGSFQVDVLGATLLFRDTLHKDFDTLVWKVYMKDAANHMSNVIETAPLILFK